jgi:hypothetical protein
LKHPGLALKHLRANASAESKPRKGTTNRLQIGEIGRNPNIDVAGCPRVAMHIDGIPTDDQIFNLLLVEALEELFEVAR